MRLARAPCPTSWCCRLSASRLAMLAWARKLFRRYLDSKSVLLVNFLFALVNLFLLVMHLHVRMPPAKAYFYSALSVQERDQMLEILRVFTEEMDRHQILYFISSGTLIGSYRHHGPIPWDDDVAMEVRPEGSVAGCLPKFAENNLFIEKKDLPRLKNMIAKMEPRYRLYPGDTFSPPLKFYSPGNGRRFLHHSFTWPFIDVYLLDGNKTHFIDTDLYRLPIPKNKVYPLIRRPYQGMWLLTPCNTSFLLGDYDIEECHSRHYSHLMEVPMFMWTQRHVPCKQLRHMFPFVHRATPVRRGQTLYVPETLKVDSWILSNVTIAMPVRCDGSVRVFSG